MKRILFAALLLVSCAHQPTIPDASKYEHLVVIGTNDFHGYLRPVESDFYGSKVVAGGAEWFAGYVRVLQKKYGDNLLLLDAGDIFQGTMDSNSFHGKSVLSYYNLLPYRAAAIGNHEFDYGSGKRGKPGLEVIRERMAEAKFPFLSANSYIKTTGQLWQERNLFPSTMFSVRDLKIGVVGLTTEATPSTTLPLNITSLHFGNMAEALKREAQKLRSNGADIILVAAHEGGDKHGEPIFEMLQSLPEGTVDAVVAGHSHLEIRTMIKGVPVIEAFTRGKYFGRIDLYVDKQTKRVAQEFTRIVETHPICGNWFAIKEACDAMEMRAAIQSGRENIKNVLPLRPATYEGEEVKPDLQVRKVLQPYLAQVNELRKEMLGYASEDFQRLPSGESEVGSLMAEVILRAYPKAKVAFLNGGGIRRMFAKGPITYGDLYEVYPFENYIALVKMTGRDFKEMLRLGTAGARSVPSVSGVRFSFSLRDEEKFLRDLNSDGKKEIWERDRLLEVTWPNGMPMRDDEEFFIVTIDYLVQGGDSMDGVFRNIPAKNINIKDLSPRDILAEYLRTHKKEYLPRKSKPSITAVN